VAAIISALTERRVPTALAMTGEISLTGDIFPVGGLNEKLLAARRVGIREVILPHKNTNEISDLPKDLCEGMTFHKIKKVDEGLKIIFGPSLFQPIKKEPAKKTATKKSSSRKKPRKAGARAR
jgi:ATP-dependent Lon protease